MVGFLKSAKISTSVHRRGQKFDLSSNTLTTQNFFSLKPVYYRKMIPHDNIHIDSSVFCRLMPQIKPILGSARIVNRAFFVPFQSVMKGFDEFITQTPFITSSGGSVILKSVPYFTAADLRDLFITPNVSSLVADGLTESELDSYTFDFVDGSASAGDMNVYLFTEFGKRIYDVIVSLGYKLIPVSDDMSYNDLNGINLSALPLLCFCRIWYDWFRNTSYNNDAFLSNFFQLIPSSSSGVHFNVVQLASLFDFTSTVNFDSDYFVSQWDHPEGPNDSAVNPDIRIDDITSHRNFSGVATQNAYSRAVVGTDSVNGTPIVNGFSGSSPSPSTPSAAPLALSQYIVDSLKRLTDFIHRRQLVGNRTLDNFLALFGIESSYQEIFRSKIVGHWDIPLRFAEVMANTDNSAVSQPLGDFAGRAVGFSEKPYSFSFDCQDKHGMLIICSYIEPKTGYCDGVDRNILDLGPLDFYQGDFDHLGAQATYNMELYSDLTKSYKAWSNTSPQGIFGYMPRYAHMKIGHDILSGDFYRPIYKKSMSVWHNFRMFDDQVQADEQLPEHDFNFCIGDRSQFNRIFAIQDVDGISADNFITAFHFDVSLYSVMTKLWDNYEFEHEEEHYQVVQRINGSTASD